MLCSQCRALGNVGGPPITWSLGLQQVVLDMDSMAIIHLIQAETVEIHHLVLLREIKDNTHEQFELHICFERVIELLIRQQWHFQDIGAGLFICNPE